MALEDLTGSSKYIDDLDNANPVASDSLANQDDHTRGIKNVLLNSFPGVTGAVTSTHTELNILDGVTSTTAELNILDGVTATAAELNLLDGVTSTTAELNILDGVTATAAELNAAANATTWTVVATGDSPVTAVLGTKYYCDLSGGAITINLPSVGSSDDGNFVAIKTDENASTNNLTVATSDTDTIADTASPLTVDTDFLEATLVYDDTQTNWGL